MFTEYLKSDFKTGFFISTAVLSENRYIKYINMQYLFNKSGNRHFLISVFLAQCIL